MNENLPGLYPRLLDSGKLVNQSLIGPNAPVYVAGFDLGVLPIGVWSILIILSTSSMPLKVLNGIGIFLDLLLFKLKFKALYKVWSIKVDFPLPETPVTHVKQPKGIFKFTFFKLFPVAPPNCKNLPFLASLLFFGSAINFLLDKYFPVILSSFLIISSKLPCATTLPPLFPASGPKSIIWSALSMVSVSCSTTITVFPKSRNLLSAFINFILSFWCNPIEGSSKTYNTPVNPEPICEAKRILWASPPDSVADSLDKVK